MKVLFGSAHLAIFFAGVSFLAFATVAWIFLVPPFESVFSFSRGAPTTSTKTNSRGVARGSGATAGCFYLTRQSRVSTFLLVRPPQSFLQWFRPSSSRIPFLILLSSSLVLILVPILCSRPQPPCFDFWRSEFRAFWFPNYICRIQPQWLSDIQCHRRI